mgnify:CR=1 FL=1
MKSDVVLCQVDRSGIGTITINRPDVRNAYNAELLEALTDAVNACGRDETVRVIRLRGNGSHFQAGADIKWLRANASLSPEENITVSALTTNTMKQLNECGKPIIALVQGGCYGGGMGIVASADIVIAEQSAQFAITEARWGLVGGPIFPQLIAAIGQQHTRRYALSVERFSADRAREIGLVHQVCKDGNLDKAAVPLFSLLLRAGPNALQATKALILDVTGIRLSNKVADWIVKQNSQQRRSMEAVEGLGSFLDNRMPQWYSEDRYDC